MLKLHTTLRGGIGEIGHIAEMILRILHITHANAQHDSTGDEERRDRKNVLILSGVVGSGKTALTQAILRILQDYKSRLEFNLLESALQDSNMLDSNSLESTALDSSAQKERLHTEHLHATSPTFSIMHDYGSMCHYDLYNHAPEQLLQLGLLDWLGDPRLHCIEWGESLLEVLVESGFSCALVKIHTPHSTELARDERVYEVYI